MFTGRQILTLLAFTALVMTNFNKVFTSLTPWRNANVLLVTAHPDDETMFFGPTIRNVIAEKYNNTLVMLVLSNGNAEGLGAVRTQEMYEAAHRLGVTPYNVKIVDDPALQDSLNSTWDPHVVEAELQKVADVVQPDFVITFDHRGISGHPNHKAAFAGSLRYALSHKAKEHNVDLYTLTSVPLFRKYLFVFDGILGRLVRSPMKTLTIISSNYDYYITRTALTKGHPSQMTWYRKLYSFFSRYMVVNDLTPIDLDRAARVYPDAVPGYSEEVAGEAEKAADVHEDL